MRLLLCGEGVHDVGVSDSWDARLEEFVSLDGWLQPLIRNSIQSAPEFFVRKRHEIQVQDRGLSSRQRLRGHGVKAFLAKRLAVTSNYDVLIYMADADSNNVQDWRRHVADIEAGFAALQAGAVNCIACVPMSASESWLMSDPSAWAIVADTNVEALPRRPETIWGERDDPEGDHPHRFFSRVCRTVGLEDNRDTRSRIAQAMSLITGQANCPHSMPPFLAGLRR